MLSVRNQFAKQLINIALGGVKSSSNLSLLYTRVSHYRPHHSHVRSCWHPACFPLLNSVTLQVGRFAEAAVAERQNHLSPPEMEAARTSGSSRLLHQHELKVIQSVCVWACVYVCVPSAGTHI